MTNVRQKGHEGVSEDEALDLPDTFAQWVRARRDVRHLTRAELAERTRYSEKNIQAIEEGKHRPRKDLALAMATHLRLATEDEEWFSTLFIEVARRHRPVDDLPDADPYRRIRPGKLLARQPCPYPGLRAFQQDDAAYFWGRTSQSIAMCSKLKAFRLIFLIGPSGSGKSSLVQAGVIPRLKQSAQFVTDSWHISTIRLGDAPLLHLRSQFPEDDTGVSDTEPERKPINRLIVIDPLEEVFTQAPHESDALFTELERLTKRPGYYAIGVIRADFHHHLMSSARWSIVEPRSLYITPLDAQGLREAIVAPAEAVGVTVEPELVQRLISDAAGEPGVMPLFQATLVQLWDELDGNQLSLKAYTALARDNISPLYCVLADQADAALAALDERGRIGAWRILLRLVQFGEGRAHTRRQIPQSACEVIGQGEAELTALLEHLKGKSLLALGAGEQSQRTVDLAHEALLAHWPAYLEHIKRYQKAEQQRRLYDDRALQWYTRSREGKIGGLLSEMEVQDIEEWMATDEVAVVGYSSPLTDLLQASKAAIDESVQQRRAVEHQLNAQTRSLHRMSRTLVSIIALLGLVSIIGAGWFLRREAIRWRVDQEAEMVPIPEGQAIIGFETKDHPENIHAYKLDKFEVSNRQYRACVEAGNCIGDIGSHSQSNYDDVIFDNYPVVNIPPIQAKKFCEWRGHRLPTELEWERAVRGIYGRKAPWGDAYPKPKSVQLSIDGYIPDRLVEVFALPKSATPKDEGSILHLLGNVAEIVSEHTVSSNRTASYIAVGGSYLSNIKSTYKINHIDSLNGLPLVGFRCAGD